MLYCSTNNDTAKAKDLLIMFLRALHEHALPPRVQRVAIAYGGNSADSVAELRHF